MDGQLFSTSGGHFRFTVSSKAFTQLVNFPSLHFRVSSADTLSKIRYMAKFSAKLLPSASLTRVSNPVGGIRMVDQPFILENLLPSPTLGTQNIIEKV